MAREDAGMKIARRIAALVTAALLCMFSGEGRALTDEDYDYWYEQMTYLVYEIRNQDGWH